MGSIEKVETNFYCHDSLNWEVCSLNHTPEYGYKYGFRTRTSISKNFRTRSRSRTKISKFIYPSIFRTWRKKTIRTPYFKFQINPYPNPYPYLKKLCFGTRTRNRIPYLYSVKVNADKVIRYSKWKIWNGKLEITLAALFTCLLHDRFNEFVVTMTVPVDQWKYILGVTCIYIIWKTL